LSVPKYIIEMNKPSDFGDVMKRESILTHKTFTTIVAKGGSVDCGYASCGERLRVGDTIITSKMSHTPVRRFHKMCWEYMQI
jgi:hypothetical protein